MKIWLKCLVGGCLPLLFCFIVIIGLVGGSVSQHHNQVKENAVRLSEKVLTYRPMVEKYASEQGISDYVPYLLAIMEVESKGEGVDPMQSSESINGQIGNITNPEDSIKQGVKHFKHVLEKAKEQNTDIWSAVQAYNYGSGFIDFVSSSLWTFEKAEQFSKEQAQGRRVNYVNDISKSKGYDYRYDYGNMFYVLLVKHYLQTGESVPSVGEWLLPIDHPVVTSYFNEHRDLVLQDGSRYISQHHGIDLVNGEENAPIKAVAHGKVVYSGYRHDTGLTVIIEHQQVYTYYFHLSVIMVGKNEVVRQGHHIGVIGSSGYSTGTHLHFGVSSVLWSNYIDPLPLLPEINKR